MNMNITWARLAGLPSYGEVLSFHLPDERLLGEGVVFEFNVDGHAWVGNFAPGMSAHSAVYVIGSTIHVISAGNGYRFRAAAPTNYEILKPGVVTDSRMIDERCMLVLAGLVNISAYGERGLLWATPRLSMEGVTLQECTARGITGVANTVAGEAHYFAIDPATGHYTSGTSYP